MVVKTLEKQPFTLNLKHFKLGDAASNGLVYVLCDTNGNQLTPASFCKDIFQDFGYCHVTGTTSGEIYGFDCKKAYKPDFFKNNETVVMYVFPEQKALNSPSVPKIQELKDSFKNVTVYQNWVSQLEIFDSICLQNNWITKRSIPTYEKILFNGVLIDTFKLEFSTEFFLKPQVTSLFTLLLRNFINFKIFVTFETWEEDLEHFLSTVKKIPTAQYIYSNDCSILTSDKFILKLPLFLKDKLSKDESWENYKGQNIGTIHNNSGIFSHLAR